jgi:uncharacterized protein (TIGR00255 family)
MKSMTGFGAAQFQTQSVNIEISVRSVNGRFLEPRFHMPREYLPFETDLKSKLSKYFSRGTIDVFISRKVKPTAKTVKIQLNSDVVDQYQAISQKIAKKIKEPVKLQVESLLRLPEVLILEQESLVRESEKSSLFKVFDKACKSALVEREREGQSLRRDLSDILNSLDRQVLSLGKHREEANQHLQERFESKLKNRGPQMDWDTSRVTQEVVLQLEKTDINEELSRLQEHLKNYRQIIMSSDTQGKKLDFYTQELLREVNTIGSKSNLSNLTQAVVEAKTFIERLREQVQNVE